MGQFPLFEDDVEAPGLDMTVIRAALTPVEADRVMNNLHAEIEWDQEWIVMFGKRSPVPRLTSWHGEENAVYTYSNIKMTPKPWTPTLLEMRDLCQEHAHHTFNSVLANFYRDGKDGNAWHADDERELGKEPVIASLSFGATRAFQFRRTYDHSRKVAIDLHHGDLIIMRGLTQHLWQHRIAKTAKVFDGRINLTFRWIDPNPKKPIR